MSKPAAPRPHTFLVAYSSTKQATRLRPEDVLAGHRRAYDYPAGGGQRVKNDYFRTLADC
jgi:hypothetical protein